jgi:hypothetical protein
VPKVESLILLHLSHKMEPTWAIDVASGVQATSQALPSIISALGKRPYHES